MVRSSVFLVAAIGAARGASLGRVGASTWAEDDDSAAALFKAIPYICGVLGHHLAPNHNGNHKGGVETDLLLHAPVFYGVYLCAPPWPLVEKKGKWEHGQRPEIVAKTCGGGLEAFYYYADGIDVDGPCERRFDPRTNRGMFHYWVDVDVQISTRLRLPPPVRSRVLGGAGQDDGRPAKKTLVVATPHLAREGRAQTCPRVRASCLTFGEVRALAAAAVERGYAVKLWATNLEDGHYHPKNGGTKVSSAAVAAESTAAADALAKLFPGGEVAVVAREEEWRGGVPQKNLTNVLRDLAAGSLYVSGFGGIGTASLAYMGAHHVVLCERGHGNQRKGGLHKDTYALFCDRDLLESLSRQTVHLVDAPAEVLPKLVSLMDAPSEEDARYARSRLPPYPSEAALRARGRPPRGPQDGLRRGHARAAPDPSGPPPAGPPATQRRRRPPRLREPPPHPPPPRRRRRRRSLGLGRRRRRRRPGPPQAPRGPRDLLHDPPAPLRRPRHRPPRGRQPRRRRRELGHGPALRPRPRRRAPA